MCRADAERGGLIIHLDPFCIVLAELSARHFHEQIRPGALAHHWDGKFSLRTVRLIKRCDRNERMIIGKR